MRPLLLFGLVLGGAAQPYSPSLALSAVYAGAAAYCEPAAVEAWSKSGCLACTLSGLSLTNVTYLTDAATNVSSRAYVGRSQQGRGALSFEGSADIEQWIEDLKFALVPWAGCAGCRVHLGFSEAYLLLSSAIAAKLAALAPLVDLWVFGHSLGGAEAALAAYDLAQAGFPVTAVYTAGAPRVGDGTWAAAFNNFVVHGHDTAGGLNLQAVAELRLSPLLARAASKACLHTDNAALFADAEEARALAATLIELGELSVERAAGRLRRAPPTLAPHQRAALGRLKLQPPARAFAGAAVDRLVHYADVVPHLPPSAWGYEHTVREVWYSEASDSVRVCSNVTGEDASCSNQLPVSSLTVSDHSEYLNVSLTKSCD